MLKRLLSRLGLSGMERSSSNTIMMGCPGLYLGNNRVLLRVLLNRSEVALILPADDLLITPWFAITGQYEATLTKYFLKKLRRSSVCIDIGANFGYFTCLFARKCAEGTVVGVEADERIFSLLRDNIAINGFSERATAIHAAAAAGNGQMTLYRRVTRPGNTSVVFMDDDFTRSLGEPPVQPFTVAIVSVDSIARNLGKSVDFLKIDVEGAEPLVIEGARETIAGNPDLHIVMEWSPGQIQCAGFDLSEFADKLQDMNLEASVIRDGSVDAISFSNLKTLGYQPGILLRRR